MLTVCFSHLDLMKYFPECIEATKWGEWMTSPRPDHSSHIRQPINRHICTEGETLMVWLGRRWISRPLTAFNNKNYIMVPNLLWYSNTNILNYVFAPNDAIIIAALETFHICNIRHEPWKLKDGHMANLLILHNLGCNVNQGQIDG